MLFKFLCHWSNSVVLSGNAFKIHICIHEHICLLFSRFNFSISFLVIGKYTFPLSMNRSPYSYFCYDKPKVELSFLKIFVVVFVQPEEINVLRISDDGSTLYASTDSRVYRLPTDNCGRFLTCDECVAGMDPACSWINDDGCKANTTG